MIWCLRLLVLAPMLFNAIWLAPELTSGVPSRNDNALHLLMINAASDALKSGHNPFDFWIPQLELGFPQFLYYQNLPHLVVVALHRALFGLVELETVFHSVVYLLLVGFPLTVHWSMRRMGFSPVAAAFGAAASTLLGANARYGFEYESYLWRGVGLYTQLWAMHLSFFALAFLVSAINDGRALVRTGVVLGMLALSHLVYAYMTVITSLVVVLTGSTRKTLAPRAARLVIVGLIGGALAAYMLWPFLETSRLYLSNLPGLKDNGPSRVTSSLSSAARGRLFDYHRLPVITLLVAIGAIAALVRRGKARVLAVSGLSVWLVLFLWRPRLGPLGDLLPAHTGFISFRFIGAVCLFAILSIGVAGEAIWDAIARLRSLSPRVHAILATAVLALTLAPAVRNRAQYYEGNRDLIAQTRDAIAADTDLATILKAVEVNPGGRVYAGRRRSWGRQLRVGPSLTVSDMINAHRLPAIGTPFQALALNSGLLQNFRDGDPGLYDVFDVRTVITQTGAAVPPFYRSLFQTGRYTAWRVATSGAAEYIEITARRPARGQRSLYVGNSDWFVSAAPAMHQAIRWDYMRDSVPFVPRARCADGGQTISEQVESQRVQVTVECGNASALALKMSYHPNWKVTVDGKPVETYIVSPSFIGLDLEAGRHVVDARYVPTKSKMPLLALGLLVLALAIVYRKRLDFPGQWMARATVALLVLGLMQPRALSAQSTTSTAGAARATITRRASDGRAPPWTVGATCYEVFVRSFADSDGDGIGDLRGLIAKLDYINDGNPRSNNDLGARCIWLMPVAESPSYHGYDVSDYYRVERDYGTTDDFKLLMTAAHQRGIRVLVDMVLNHMSKEHPFFQTALRDTTSPYRSLFRWSPTPGPNNKWGGNNWHKSPVRNEYYYAFFWEGMPDLNYEQPAALAEMKKVATYWLTEMGVDGFRLDAVKFLVERGAQADDTPGTHAVLREFATHVRRTKPSAFTIGEVFDSTASLLTYYPNQLDAYFAFEVADSIINGVRRGDARGLLAPALRLQSAVPNARWSPFLRNHDQPRTVTELGDDPEKARLAAFVMMTMPGLPFVYYGEELGMSGPKPDELIRTPMAWSTKPPHAGFTTGTPWQPLRADSVRANVELQNANGASLLHWYRQLIHVRADNRALASGTLIPLGANRASVAAYLRRDAKNTVLALVNLDTAVAVQFTASAAGFSPGRYRLQPLVGDSVVRQIMVAKNGRIEWADLARLPRRSAMLFQVTPLGR